MLVDDGPSTCALARPVLSAGPVTAAWQREYDSPGEALDALLAWRAALPARSRPVGYTIAGVPGRAGAFMIILSYPEDVVLEVMEDALACTESTRASVEGYLRDCVETTLAERG